MAHIHIPHEIPVRYVPRSRGTMTAAVGLFLAGLVSFIIVLTQDPARAWASYVSNWLFFTSVAMGGVMVAVATTIVKAKWNWSVRRVSVSFAAFLPIAFLLFLPMLGLREEYFHWITEMAEDPILQAKQAWLNVPFLVIRNVVALVILFGLALNFAYLAVRPDLGLTNGASDPDEGRRQWRERLTTSWLGQEKEEVRSFQRMNTMAPGMVLAFAVIMSLLAFDWAMALEPHWYSTLFGGWFFMSSFWAGFAATAVAAVWLGRQDRDLAGAMGIQQRHDLGKLTFGFTVFWAYLFWSQYIVIWYGKLPWEQAWMIHRAEPPWGKMSALVILLCFVVPFAGLLGRTAKRRPGLLATFTGLILLGLWLERYMLVAPSLHEEGAPVFGLWHPLIALLFLGPFIGALRWAWSTFPVIQIWQPMALPESVEAEKPAPSVEAGGRR